MAKAPRNHLQRIHTILAECNGSQDAINGLHANIKGRLEATRLCVFWTRKTEAVIETVLNEALDVFFADLIEASTPPVQVDPVEIEKQTLADGRVHFNIVIDEQEVFSMSSGANAQIAKRIIDGYRQRIAELEAKDRENS